MDSYFALLNLSLVENNNMSIFTMFAKQSMINRLSNPINRNRSAAKISKVMSSSADGNITIKHRANLMLAFIAVLPPQQKYMNVESMSLIFGSLCV